MKKAIIAVVFVGTLGAGAYYSVKHGRMLEVENAPSVSAMEQAGEALAAIAKPDATPDEIERARAMLEQATAMLAQEETRLLAEIETASSTAAAQIAEIMAHTGEEITARNAKIEAINSIRSSF